VDRSFRNDATDDDAYDDDDDDDDEDEDIEIIIVGIVVEVGVAANGVDDRGYRGWFETRGRSEEAVVVEGENW